MGFRTSNQCLKGLLVRYVSQSSVKYVCVDGILDEQKSDAVAVKLTASHPVKPPDISYIATRWHISIHSPKLRELQTRSMDAFTSAEAYALASSSTSHHWPVMPA